MASDLSLLYRPVRERLDALLVALAAADMPGRVVWTLRTPADQVGIYGHERFTLHYLGLAVDWYPDLKGPAKTWQQRFNAYPMWDKYQCELAVEAGFDKPEPWQLKGDRPHIQCRFGIPETEYRRMWYVEKIGKDGIQKWLDKVLPTNEI